MLWCFLVFLLHIAAYFENMQQYLYAEFYMQRFGVRLLHIAAKAENRSSHTNRQKYAAKKRPPNDPKISLIGTYLNILN